MRFYSDADTSNSSERGGQMHIAVINNDVADVKYLKEVLETIGEVTVFLSSKDFMRKVKPGAFDFAVSGMAMPEATGLDILNFLVQQKITLPVILYSNIIQKEVIMQALKLGASSYLIKPQPPEVIVQKALEIINARS